MDLEKDEAPLKGRIAIIAVTRGGAGLALKIQSKLSGSRCYVSARHRFAVAMGAVGYERLAALFPLIWPKYPALICIMATGIVVRLIAPLLRHKTSDPAVVVVDERGNFAISLVSGHLGGANNLAKEVAHIIGGQAVITTASDVCEKPAWDMMAVEAGLEIENMEMLPRFARAVVEDEPIWVCDAQDLLGPYLAGQPNVFHLPSKNVDPREFPDGPRPWAEGGAACGEPPVVVWVSEYEAPAGFQCLILRPRNLVVGLGCNRGTPVQEVLDFLSNVFREERLSLLSIRNLASVDLKADEPAILEAGKALNRPVRFYPRNEIENIAVPNPSCVVARHIGAPSVCEATALLSAGTETLLIPKLKTANVTLAVARVGSPS